MHNIKKIGIRVLLIAFVVFLYENIVEFLYRPYNESIVYINQDRKEVDGSIETLLCGTSTIQRGVDPEIIEKRLETVCFNTASSMQPIDGTYELIKDISNSNPVETVILGISPDSMKKKQVNTKFKSRLYDRLQTGRGKIGYLISGCSVNEWPYMMLYSARVENYFDTVAIRKNMGKKTSQEYQVAQIDRGNYKGKGMMATKNSFDAEQVKYIEKKKSKFRPENIKKHNLEYLSKIVQYCEENQIELILVYPPLTGTKIEEYGDISTIHDYYNEFAKKYDIQFWDFNYEKDLKNVFTNDKFEDEKHLNMYGAEIFSQKLADVYYECHMGEDIQERFLNVCPYYIDSESAGEEE